MQSAPTILDYITLAIAIWGAVLSTILAVRNFQRDKRRIRVTCSLIEQTLSSEGVPHNLILGIKAVNTGHRDVKLENAGFITKSKKFYVADTHRGLPVTLGDGASITIRVKLDDAQTELKNISSSEIYVSAYVKDIEGTLYKTSRLPDVMINRKMAKRSWGVRK